MLTPSLPNEDDAGLSASAWRRIEAGMLVRSAAGVPRLGVIPWTDAPLVTGTTDLAMTYQIAPFLAFTARNSAGAERVVNDAAEFVSTTAAPGSNSRIDVIWVRCLFPLAGDTGTAPLFGVTQGVANATPSKPSIPAGALELASAVVTSADLTTQTVVITPTVQFTALAGGMVWFRNATEMNGFAALEGQLGYRLDTEATYQYLGSTIGWVHVSGKPTAAAITPNAAGGVSAGDPAPRVVDQGGRVYPEGILVATSSSWTAGTEYGVGTADAVPAAYAPKVEKRFPILSNDVFFGQIIFKTDGRINWRPAQSYTAGLILPLDGPSWPLKKLV